MPFSCQPSGVCDECATKGDCSLGFSCTGDQLCVISMGKPRRSSASA